MADTLGQQDLRGMNVDKLIKGFAEESFVFKNDLTVSPTSAREIRWFQKTSGVPLTGPTTTGITTSPIRNQAFGTIPPIVEDSVTRMTSQVQHYAAETPWFTYADIKDSDPDMLALNLRQLTRSIQNQIDYNILNTLSGSVPLSGSAMGAGWDDASAGNPFLDLISGSMQIRTQGYDVNGVVAWVYPSDYKNLVNYFVTVKGSSVPALASATATDGTLTQIANVRIKVSNNCTPGQVLLLVPQTTATWKEFTPITAITKEEPGVGVKIRGWEDGVCLVTDPYAACLLKSVN